MMSKTSEGDQATRPDMEKDFETPYNEFAARLPRGLKEYEEWNDHPTKELGSGKNVREYHKWVRKQNEEPRPDSSRAALAKSIPFANWIYGNTSTDHLNSVIRDTRYRTIRQVQDLQCRYDDFRVYILQRPDGEEYFVKVSLVFIG